VVELAVDDRRAQKEHGFLVVTSDERPRVEYGRVPLDDIEALIISGRDVCVSRGLLASLAERNCPVVITDKRYRPASFLMPTEGHHLQAKRFDAQIHAGASLKKRAWATVVKFKLRQQAQVLTEHGAINNRLDKLASLVQSGDPSNCEAQGARIYWPALLGTDFRRDRDAPGANALLNYGYTVLRASAARAVVAAGLHPTLGIHHKNGANAFRLVDDVMEPYRPLVDLQVLTLLGEGRTSVSTEEKRSLVDVLSWDLVTDGQTSPVGVCVQKSASSLAEAYLGEREGIWFPQPQIPKTKAGQPPRGDVGGLAC